MAADERRIAVGGKRIRVDVRWGRGVPLVLCSAIGAELEVFDPLVARLDPAATVVRFDVPGVGGSSTSVMPYALPCAARLLGRVLTELGFAVVDVLGHSWGGALAQQFALQNPRRCRRLVLVASGSGVLMVPPSPRVMLKMLRSRRSSDPAYAASVAGDVYGGCLRGHDSDLARIDVRHLHAASRTGYLHQILAGATWTSLLALPALRQQTLIVAGTDDPMVPAVNARVMRALLPHARLHLHPGGHLDLLYRPAGLVPVIDGFLRGGAAV